jgi:uncharacterized membrane protein
MSERRERDVLGPPTRWGTDLQSVLLTLGLLWAVTLLPVVRDTSLRIVVALVVALFVPGYALIAALFPERGSSVSDDGSTTSTDTPTEGSENATESGGIDVLERVVLSFGASIALVPLIGLILNFTPWGLRLVPILVGLTVLTVPLTVLAAFRRARHSPNERFDPHPGVSLVAGLRGLTTPDDRTDAILNVLLVVSLLLAAGSVAYAVGAPGPQEEFSEFYLLSETEDGELVAANYPRNLTTGESTPLVVGIANEEGRQETYTVVTQLQTVQIREQTLTVTDSRELGRFTETLADGETANVTREVTPRELTGERLRLQFLLFRGEVPESPNTTTAYRETHLWVNVTTAESEQASLRLVTR